MESKKAYTEEQEKWILDHYNKVDTFKTLTILFNDKFNTNKTYFSVKARCQRLGVISNINNNIYTEEENQWLRDNIDKYSRKEIVDVFNERFNKNKTEGCLKKHCNSKLKLYFKTNYDRYRQGMSISQPTNEPIGTEKVSTKGDTFIKTSNNNYNYKINWVRKDRLLHPEAADNEKVLILDKGKPLTKENTIVISKSAMGYMLKNKYFNLSSQLKKIAVKNCELSAVINTIKRENKENE